MHTNKCLCLKTKLHTDTENLCNQAAYNQLLQLVLCSSWYTLVRTYIFSPFWLFSEVARPLSKVCFAKGRVHFHIFPFDMRRLSIQGYVFLRRFLPLPILSPSFCSAHSFIPVPPLLPPHSNTLRACLGVLGRRDTNNYRATTGERNTGLCMCVRECECAFMQDCRGGRKKKMAVR